MKKVIVTGGSGFVGSSLCLALKKRGYDVVSISRRDVPFLRQSGIGVVQLDLAEENDGLDALFHGVEGVFHVAAHVAMWGDYEKFYRTNVVGTKRLVEACKRAGVPRFVYTSSPSVVANGSDLCGINEKFPYPDRFKAYYPQTKAIAEQYVLAANFPNRFHTVALRPHLIFGPNDTNLIPTILKKAKSNALMQIGDGSNVSDFTFIDDCVTAHILAFEALGDKSLCAGKPYFISQGKPINLWDFVNAVLGYNDLPPITRKIPMWVAMSLAIAGEFIARHTPFIQEPRLTTFLVTEMGTSHYFSIDAACNDFGFKPSVTVEEGLKITFNEASPIGTSLPSSGSAKIISSGTDAR